MSIFYWLGILAAAVFSVACTSTPSLHFVPVASAMAETKPGAVQVSRQGLDGKPAQREESGLAGAVVPALAPGSTADHREKAGQSVLRSRLEDAKFRSVELREVGLGPKGVVMGHWALVFRGGLVSWRHSDVVEKAAFELGADGAITSAIENGKRSNPPASAHYEGRTDRVFWGGMWYERVPPSSPDAKGQKP